MTFRKTTRRDILENNQYAGQIFEAEFGGVNPRPGNHPALRIPHSVQVHVERSDDDECNDIRCNDYNSDVMNGVWDKVSDVTPESTDSPVTLTHTDDPVTHTHTDSPVVVTHSGPVRGLTLDQAHVFYGIPYAAPPVGPKRWAAPEPVSQWTRPYDATFPRPACVQACAGEFSEECPHKVIPSPPIT